MVTVTYQDRELVVNGLNLHYQEWGPPNAPVILMLHGFGVSGHMFDEFADRLQERYRLIALDQRGHGDSAWSEDGDYSREAFVNDIEAFRLAMGLSRFVLVAHSMGGLNAVSYANKYPETVSALVLVDVGPESAKEGVDNIIRFTRGPDELEFEEFVEMAHRFNQRRTIENIRERMRHRLKQMPSGKYTWKFDARFRKQDNGLRVGSELSNDEMWKLYRSLRPPTLLIRGSESDVLTSEVADRCVREMQRARLVVVPGAGHSVPGDNPDGFTAAVQAFLDDVDAGVFEPAVEVNLPPLADLVTVQQRAERRRAGSLALIFFGAGALAALTGALLLARRSKKREATDDSLEVSDRPASRLHLPSLHVVEELSEVGRRGTGRARHLLADVDIEHARAAAIAVGERTKALPAAARAIAPVRRRRSRKARVARRAFGLLLPGIGRRNRKKKSGLRLLPWR